MRRIRTTGELSWADGNASAGQKLILSDKASQWTSFLAAHSNLLETLLGHDDQIGGKEGYTKTVEAVDTSATLELPASEAEQGDVRKVFLAISGGDNPVILTLPTGGMGAVASGVMFIAQRYSQNVAFKPGSGDSILMPWGTVADSTHIQCDDTYGVMCLMSDGNDTWVPVWATGTWYEAGTPAKLHRYDGNLKGAVSGDFASFDTYGNVADSGYAAADFMPKRVASESFDADPGVSTSDYGKLYWSTSGGSDPAPFVVRSFGQVGANFMIERRLVDVTVAPYSGESILMPWGTVSSSGSMRCDDPYGAIYLVCIGSGYWLPLWATGTWYDSADVSNVHCYSDAHPFGRQDIELLVANRTVTAADEGKLFFAAGGTPPIVITLPDSPTVGFSVQVATGGTRMRVACQGSNVIMLPGGLGTLATIESDTSNTGGRLVYNGSNMWGFTTASGYWEDDTTSPSTTYRFDANVPGATQNDFASFDANGNIQNSGYAGSDFAAATHATGHLAGGSDELEYRGEVFLPIEDAKDYSEDAPAALENLIDAPGVLPIRKFDPTAQEETSFLWEVPDDIVASNGVKVTVVGAISEATAPASGEGVVFKVAGYCVGHGDQLGGTFGTAQASQDADLYTSGADAQYDRFELNQSVTITITDLAPGELVVFNLYRDVADSNDDYGQDVGISGMRVLYNKTPIQGW